MKNFSSRAFHFSENFSSHHQLSMYRMTFHNRTYPIYLSNQSPLINQLSYLTVNILPLSFILTIPPPPPPKSNLVLQGCNLKVGDARKKLLLTFLEIPIQGPSKSSPAKDFPFTKDFFLNNN